MEFILTIEYGNSNKKMKSMLLPMNKSLDK